MTTPRFPVENVVIGGGLAGSMAALRLASAGREVLLFERDPVPTHKVCGEFLSAEAVGYLREAGIDPLALGAALIHRVRLSCGARSIEADLPFSALSLSRRVLDAALLARATRSGCTVRTGATVESMLHDPPYWRIQTRFATEAGNPPLPSADGTIVRSRTAILATGKHDVRGWPRPSGRQNDLVGFKMHFRLAPVQTESLRGWMDLFLFRNGYGGLALVENGIANLCLVVRRSELRRSASHSSGSWPGILAGVRRESALIDSRLDAALPLWDRPLAISSIPYGYLADRDNGAWCIGDQAAVIPSFTGDGMSIALHSAALAADMLLEGQSPSDYRNTLRSQLSRSMMLATNLSRTMVTPFGRMMAPWALSAFPEAMDWIARGTRIPQRALLCSL